VILLLVRVALAAVFAAAGYFKLADRTGTRQTLSELRVPFSLTGALAVAIPVAELAIAAALIPISTAHWGALAALALLAVFSLGIALALLHDRRPDCNCFGTLNSAPLGWGIVARNVGFAGLAALVYWYPDSLDGLSGTALLATAGTALAAALGLQAWFSWQLFRQHGRLIARIESLERGGLPTARGGMIEALQPGDAIPQFELPDLHGEPRSLEDLLVPGRPLALVFSDPLCGACDRLLPELARLADHNADDLEVVLVSRGTAAENRAKLNGTVFEHVLLQEDRELATPLGVDRVPSAVIVGSDGRVASPVVSGQADIERLLDPSPRADARLELVSVGGPR
jgi:peroxiredoxin